MVIFCCNLDLSRYIYSYHLNAETITNALQINVILKSLSIKRIEADTIHIVLINIILER